MNTKKISVETQKDLLLLFKNGIPVSILAEAFSVTSSTIAKYIPQKDWDEKIEFFESTYAMRVHLLELYAWLICDELSCVKEVGTPRLLDVKFGLYKYLHIKEYECFLDGVLAYHNMQRTNFFEQGVSDNYQKLINDLFPFKLNELTGPKLCVNILNMMHHRVFSFPTVGTIGKPEMVFAEFLRQFISGEYEYRYFTIAFTARLKLFIDEMLHYNIRQKEILEAWYGISEHNVSSIMEKYKISEATIKLKKDRALKRLSIAIPDFLELSDCTPSRVLNMKDQVIRAERQEKMSQETIGHLTQTLKKAEQEKKTLAHFLSTISAGVNTPEPVLHIMKEALDLPKDATVELVEKMRLSQVLDTPIEDLEFSVRTFNCLRSAKIHTLHDLVQLSVSDLKCLRHMGEKSIKEVKRVLAEHNLQLAED